MIDPRTKRIADYYGRKPQTYQAIEELNELAVELSHHVRLRGTARNLVEEIADVEIMLEQMKYLYGDDDSLFVAIDKIKEKKISRQLKRIAEEEYEREVCMDG